MITGVGSRQTCSGRRSPCASTTRPIRSSSRFAESCRNANCDAAVAANASIGNPYSLRASSSRLRRISWRKRSRYCARIKANPEAFARLNSQQQALVQAGHIALGFDTEAVKLALGDPDRTAIRTDADGETIIWHYVTYESEGLLLYSGYYHTGRRWGGWGPVYPYYLDFPDRRVRDRFRVEFKG